MARFILKWRYIKSGTKQHGKNILKYIATREGVEKIDQSWKHQSATTEQHRLIGELIKDFPEAVESLEYQDYKNSPTKYSASQFISQTLEENIDIIGKKENYIGYIARRPHVEKQGTHGLFTQTDGVINLKGIAKTVAEHDGVVWTTIMSLRREDAERLGYDNASAWRDLLRSQSNKLAKAMRIPLNELRWYAAFHNEGSHPHIHLVSYSVGKEPYMTEQGLSEFKSNFAKEIFKHDLFHTYEDTTAYRNELRRTGKEKINAIVKQINSGTYENETIKLMINDLVDRLGDYKGKMVYGYMPKPVKNLIDGIVDELAKDERIAELYNLWYEQRDSVVKIYSDKIQERIPLSQNKEFRTIKNAVISEAIDLLQNNVTYEDEIAEEETAVEDEPKTEKKNPWTDTKDMHCQYIMAKKCLNENSDEYDSEQAVQWLELSAGQGYDIAMYKLGKIYLQGEIVEKDIHRALHWLNNADSMNNQYAQYLLGKIYLNGTDTEPDFILAEKMFEKASTQGNRYAKYMLAKMHLKGQTSSPNIAMAINLLTQAAEQNYEWAEYLLGKMYLFGQNVEKNIAEAVRYLSSAADKGNTYAQRLLDNYKHNTHGSSATVLASVRLLARLSQIIRNDAEKSDKSGRALEHKLMRKIEEKKQAQGLKMS